MERCPLIQTQAVLPAPFDDSVHGSTAASEVLARNRESGTGMSLRSARSITLIGFGQAGKHALDSAMGRFPNGVASWGGSSIDNVDSSESGGIRCCHLNDRSALLLDRPFASQSTTDLRLSLTRAHLVFLILDSADSEFVARAAQLCADAKALGVFTIAGLVSHEGPWAREDLSQFPLPEADLTFAVDALTIQAQMRHFDYTADRSSRIASKLIGETVHAVVESLGENALFGMSPEDLIIPLLPGGLIRMARLKGRSRGRQIDNQRIWESSQLIRFDPKSTRGCFIALGVLEGTKLSEISTILDAIRESVPKDCRLGYSVYLDANSGSQLPFSLFVSGLRQK